MNHTGPIILVDDDEDDLYFLEDALRTEGVKNEIKYFMNGEDAINYLRSSNEKPFLIICDINMPGMGGITLRKVIDEDPVLKPKSIPFIFLTTSATETTVKQAYEMSVQGFFQKATEWLSMAKMLRTILDYWKICMHPNDFGIKIMS